jgi:uncharacterized membrane protein
MNLKKYLTTPLQQPISKGVLIFLSVIAALGFADATYLTIEHFMNKIPPCAVGSCETVLSSAYSQVAGIPVALGGALFYLSVLVLLVVYQTEKKEWAGRFALLITFLGFLASLYFLFLQAFILNAYCIYCLGSALTSTTLFVTALVVLKKNRNEL